jgi:hypothetical protein
MAGRIARLTLATALLGGTVALAGATAPAHAAVRHGARICRKDQLYRVENWRRRQVIIRDDLFGSGRMCLTIRGRAWSSIRVASDSATGTQPLGAYPDIFAGCSWGKCSKDSPMPERVTSATRMRLTWQTYPSRPRGLWNKSFDVWLSRHRHVAGQAGGAEIMIWLDTTFASPGSSRPVVTLAGRRWWFATHRACSKVRAICWNYVLYRAVRPASGVRALPLGPFLAYAERRGLVSRSWWLGAVEAGFEVWHGGVGLGTKRFGVTS